MLSVTKRFEISYSHRLPKHKGKCKQLHGHNAMVEVEISVKDEELNTCGMVVDFGDLKWRVNEDILDRLDHQHLNKVLPENYHPPTAENILLWLKNRLLEIYPKSLTRIRFYETRDNWAEWRRE